MVRALEDDFKTVVGTSWYLWIFVIIFLLLNVNGWHTYFRIAFIPFVLLLAVGTKLEHVIIQLAHDVAEKHVAIEGDLIVKPSDDHFWFGRPHTVLFLIHFILFQNAFEIAFFFWIWVQYGYEMKMGSSFKKAIFEEHVQAGLLGWREKVRKKKGLREATEGSNAAASSQEGSTLGIQLVRAARHGSTPEEIQPSADSSDVQK